MARQVRIHCPHCQASLLVDLDAGVVLSHEPPPKTEAKIDFDARLEQLRAEKERSADKMAEALRKEKEKERLMADRFSELMKKASDDDAQPVLRDIDLD